MSFGLVELLGIRGVFVSSAHPGCWWVGGTEVGSERVRYVVSRGVCCFEDESEGFWGPPGVRAWVCRLVHKGSQSKTMCRRDREARLADLGHKGKVRGRKPQGRRTGKV